VDLFHAHIGGMDCFAKALKIAAAIRKDGQLANMVKERYSSWDAKLGKEIEAGKHSFKTLRKYMEDKGAPDDNKSGRVELFENILNSYL
jgi:xylose isomerase